MAKVIKACSFQQIGFDDLNYDRPTFRITVLAIVILGFLLFLTIRVTYAHECGPGQISMRAGETAQWQITADLTEDITHYTPVIIGNPSVAKMEPNIPFEEHHGLFTFTAIGEGKTEFSINWFYNPTGAGGDCTVIVAVEKHTSTGASINIDTNTETFSRNNTDPLTLQLAITNLTSLPTNIDAYIGFLFPGGEIFCFDNPNNLNSITPCGTLENQRLVPFLSSTSLPSGLNYSTNNFFSTSPTPLTDIGLPSGTYKAFGCLTRPGTLDIFGCSTADFVITPNQSSLFRVDIFQDNILSYQPGLPGLPEGLVGDSLTMRTGNFTQDSITVNFLNPDGTVIGNANPAPGQSSDLLVQPKQPGIYGLEALDPGNNLIGRVPIMIIGQILTPDMIGQAITAPWYTIQTRQNGEVLLHHTATGPGGIRGESFEHIGPNSNVLMEKGPPPVTSSTVTPGQMWQLSSTGTPTDFQSSLQSTTTIENVNNIHPWAAVFFPSSVSGFTTSWAGKSAITPKQTKWSLPYWDPDASSGWSAYTFISVRNVASGSETVTVKFYDQSGETLTDPIYRVAIERTGAGKLLVAEAVLGTLRVIPAETAKEVLVNGPGDMSNLARLTITEAGQISNVTLYPIDSSWPQKILRGIP